MTDDITWYQQTIDDLLFEVKIKNTDIHELIEENAKLRAEIAILLQRVNAQHLEDKLTQQDAAITKLAENLKRIDRHIRDAPMNYTTGYARNGDIK